MPAREGWIIGGALLFLLFVGGLLLPVVFSPMSPMELLLYGLAFAGGAFAFGLGLLFLCAAWLWLLGSRSS
jgi:hypothetical protein